MAKKLLKKDNKLLTKENKILNINVDDTITLKQLLDLRKTTYQLFDGLSLENYDSIINYDDTENVTKFDYMFYNKSTLKKAPNLNTSKGTSAKYLFYYCSNLQELPYYDWSACSMMDNMFERCGKLKSIKIKTEKNPTMRKMFSYCTDLKKVDISKFVQFSTSATDYWFENCYSLVAVIIRKFQYSSTTTITNYVLSSNAFTYCYRMLGTTNSTYNPEGLKDGYIYVPRDYIPVLSKATNWASKQFRALEDYTVDGTIDGEFDDVKAGLV